MLTFKHLQVVLSVMRLNQYIAKHTGISRRKADTLISYKEVKVNDEIAVLGTKVGELDKVEVLEGKNWKNISQNTDQSKVLLLYKPHKIMTTRDDPESRKTIYDLIPDEFQNYKSAGRLDFMSEGLLVLSQNGHLILSLTHPKFKTQKSYLVGLNYPLTDEQIEISGAGEIEIEDYLLNPVKITPADTKKHAYLNLQRNCYWYNFTLTEGRNRQIRKMARYFNNSVARLIRVSHGYFKLTSEIYEKGFVISTMIENKELG